MNILKNTKIIMLLLVITLFIQQKGIGIKRKSSMKTVTVHTNPNIALIKYWGKRDKKLFLPTKSSFAVTVSKLKTITTVQFNSEKKDKISFNWENSCTNEKIINFLNLFRKQYNIDKYFIVETHNEFPTGAGLASSSSGFAALALALDALCKLNLSKKKLSMLARQGSGSACRSIHGGFVLWHKGTQTDGSDSYAKQIFPHDYWPELRILIAIVKKQEKKVSSRAGMQKTMQTSPVYNQWITESKQRIEPLIEAIKQKDLPTAGKLIEADWTGMQKTMLTTQPKIDYCIPATHDVIQAIRDLREKNIEAYITTDAGPNVKIFCLDNDVETIIDHIKAVPGVLEIIECHVAQQPNIITYE